MPAPSPSPAAICTTPPDPEVLRDLIEERAAILEFDAGFSRAEAERRAAIAHGFATWTAFEAAMKGN